MFRSHIKCSYHTKTKAKQKQRTQETLEGDGYVYYLDYGDDIMVVYLFLKSSNYIH